MEDSVQQNRTARLGELMSLPQVDLSSELRTTPEEAERIYRLCAQGEGSWNALDKVFIEKCAAAYTPNQYSRAAYGEGFFSLTPSISPPIPEAKSNTVADIDTFWDVSKFGAPRLPYSIGSIQDKITYDRTNAVRCLHLPIKFPFSDIKIPEEYRQFREALQRIVDFEFSNNPNYDEYHAYLTVDQRYVPRAQSQRLPGAHVDGIPRDTKNPTRQKIDHSYIITNNLPSRFFAHPFPLERYDLTKHNFFAIMRFFADEENSIESEPYQIMLLNAYSVHTAIEATQHCYRTFMRLEFSVLEFDRRGNAVNPHFDYEWEYRDCPIPEDLILPAELQESIEQ